VRRLLAFAVLAVTLGVVPDAVAREPTIEVLSGRADLISGGNALVAVSGAPPETLRISAAGRDVTSEFAVRPDGRFAALLSGLPVGDSAITARAGRGRAVRLTVTNHPIGGPIFAGTQVQPWMCGTEEAELGPPLDAQCNAKTEITWRYRTRLGRWADYDPAAPATDVATTTTDEGKTVPFIVRVERGTQDRGIYVVAVLADPGAGFSPWRRTAPWVGKINWMFGGDCLPHHRQDAPIDPFLEITGPAVDNVVGIDNALGTIFGNNDAYEALSRGWAVANSSNNKLGSQCNSVVSAEALMMLKEHIRETYGPILHIIGTGSSGGSMQQQQIGGAYPGLLDGIQPAGSFPDIWGPMDEAVDCWLLTRYFTQTSPHLWAATAQRDAVAGYALPTACEVEWAAPSLGTPGPVSYAEKWMKPDIASNCALDAALVYSAANPKGVRCSIPDYVAQLLGRRAKDGFGNRLYDNVGIQYGLVALRDGRITAEQFVDLNEKIGGVDPDFRAQPDRTVGDLAGIETAYRAGLITSGSELDSIPVLDLRGPDPADIHADFHSYSMRARLDAANGHHRNHAIWTGDRPLVGSPTMYAEGFAMIDRWVTAIGKDRAGGTAAEKVARNRPADGGDACFVETQRVDNATCRTLFPYFGDPRIAAGFPLTDDILKCRLKPLARRDYGALLSDAQFARLRKAFPDGVCDPTQRSQGWHEVEPWTTFADGPGGRPLGPAPQSAVPASLGLPRTCTSRRRFTVRVRGRNLRSARLTVNGRSVKARRRNGRLIAVVDLRGLPRKTVRVRIAAVTTGGRRLSESRRYRTCGR